MQPLSRSQRGVLRWRQVTGGGLFLSSPLFIVLLALSVAGATFSPNGDTNPLPYVTDEAGYVFLDSTVELELKGELSPEEALHTIEIDPPVDVSADDLALDVRTKQWPGGYPWARTNVTLNTGEREMFEPETQYEIRHGEREKDILTLTTITLPRVVHASPTDGQRDVSIREAVTITFNEPVEWSGRFLQVQPNEPLTVTLEPDGSGLTLSPEGKPWRNDTTYEVTVRSGLPNHLGHQMREGFTLSFTTRPELEVIEALPEGEGHPRDSSVTVLFDAPPTPEAAEASFAISPAADGTLSWEGADTLVWTPTGRLPHSTEYTVSVGGDASREDPIRRAEWQFRTIDPVAVVSATPEGRSQPLSSGVRIEFDRPPDRDSAESSFSVEPRISGEFDWDGDTILVWSPEELEHSNEYSFSIGGDFEEADSIAVHEWAFRTVDPPVSVEIEGSNRAPTTLKAIPTGGLGEFAYEWSNGNTGAEVSLNLWYEERVTVSVTVRSGDQFATAAVEVVGPPSPCPPGWRIVTATVCYGQDVLPGPVRIHIARVDLKDPGLQIRSLPSGGTLGQTAAVSRSAANRGTVVSINGDFYNASGNRLPLGPIAWGGHYVYMPPSTLPVLAIDANLSSWAGTAGSIGMSATSSTGATMTVSRVNSAPPGDSLSVFNSYWGTRLGLSGSGCYAIVGAVSLAHAVASHLACGPLADVPLRNGEFVLVGVGSGAQWVQNHGAVFSVNISGPQASTRFIVGGSHVLLQGGSAVAATSGNGSQRHPRTAIGAAGDGFVYFIVVDGRSAASRGMTLPELQRYMTRYGIVNAVNLDGGGSSTMVIQGAVVNRPSDGKERSVSSVVEVGGRWGACANALLRC